MTAFNRFAFNGYLLRPATWNDLDLAKEWNERDADHATRVDPTFWVDQGPGEDAYLLTEETPVFFIKLVANGQAKGVIELHIQFDSAVDRPGKLKRAEALLQGLTWLQRALKVAGVKQIYFRSRNSGLILFSTKRLRFVTDPVTVDGETLLRKEI